MKMQFIPNYVKEVRKDNEALRKGIMDLFDLLARKK